MIEVRTPGRLHFGLLAYRAAGAAAPSSDVDSAWRRFGGAGLMIKSPGVWLRVRQGRGVTASGRMADRAQEFATRFFASARERGWIGTGFEGAAIEVLRVPRPHTGLGSGTQLAMAVGRALAALIGRDGLPPDELAATVGRGLRSGIGAHGFFRGGFLVDGGKRDASAASLSPIVMRHDFPEAWRLVLVRPRALEGIAGQRELSAFASMPTISDAATDRMCRLVLLGLAPALVERNVDAFGEALYELQRAVGECFAEAQGGVYADPMLEEVVRFIRARGVTGVGQSSWGPTLYAVCEDEECADVLANAVEERFGLNQAGEVMVTGAENAGAVLTRAGVEVRV